ncbi:two-component system sensor histidine kinase NtrB [Pseudorhodobacter aquimaris]|uniref:two-component system sensor histidine kinase NtrB n=1 Tax=Pseudorhodobacter aquimaris TaxID=687412 RepID=UPI00067D374E|nr:ATP-binding protein [Pseudorhodobacter aquimaris]
MMVPATLWAALPTPAMMINAKGRVAAVNPAAEDFLNLSARTLIGRPLLERLHINAEMEQVMARVIATQSSIVINDIEMTTGARAPEPCRLQFAPIQDQETLLLLIFPLEIAEKVGRAAAANSAAKSAIGMAEMLAHEIKNPLAGISGAAQLLAMNLSVEDRELSDLIVLETRRIVKLLEQVEQFGNLRPPERAAVNIHDALARARQSALVGFARNVAIIQDYDPSLPDTFADSDQLMQVFLNLIKNAVEAGAKNIRLHTFYDLSLRLRRQDGTDTPLALQVEITDDGRGISPDIAQNIFEPFVSGRENGTGLGLALASKIVLDHDGRIAVDAAPGRTTFRLSLPLAPKKAKG